MKVNLHNLAASIRTLLGNVQAHLTDNTKHVSTNERSSWNNKTDDSKIASSTELGHVKVGDNLTIGTDGKLSASVTSVPIATNSTPGLVKPNGGSTIVDSAGTLNLRYASTTLSGVVQLNDTITSSSTSYVATANAVKQVNDKIPVTETGTWTPNISMTNNNGTYSRRVGTYVRQGNLVTAYFAVTVTTLPTGSTNFFAITGFPFPANTTHYGIEFPVKFTALRNVKFGSARIPAAGIYSSGTQAPVYFYDVATGAYNSAGLDGIVLPGAEIAGSVTYTI